MSSPALQFGLRRALRTDSLKLLKRNSERDNAFAALVEEHSRLMYRIAFAVLRNAHEAEDAVQDVFLKTLRTHPDPQNARAYLSSATYRAALDRLPRKDTRSIDETEDFPSPRASQEDRASQQSDQQLLRKLIDGLPEELRQPLILTALDELTSREVATILNIPEGTVRRRASEARDQLRQRFERRTL